jgi:hypothetical protein
MSIVSGPFLELKDCHILYVLHDEMKLQSSNASFTEFHILQKQCISIFI